MDEVYDEAFEYAWTRKWINLLDDREAQFNDHLFPVSVVGEGGWEMPNWIQDYEKHWRVKENAAKQLCDTVNTTIAGRHADNAKAFGEHLKGITQEYQISFIELDRDLAIDKVCDIFTQINSRGIRLDVFDLVNAMLKPKELQLKHLWRDAAPKLEFVDTERMNVYILQVMSILLQAYCSPKYLYYLIPGHEKKVRESDGSLRGEVLIPDTTEFEIRWHEAVNAIEHAINVLKHPQEYGAILSRFLPYASILPAFASLQIALHRLPHVQQLDAQRKLRHWYWASVFTNRYSGAVESTSARDFLDVKAWFDDSATEPAMIGEFHSRFRDLDLRRETKRGTSVYNGTFNLLVLNGARDWMSGLLPQYDDLDDHHIVPKKWGNENDRADSIDSILNRTPLTADTNRNAIRDRLPNEYLPELISSNDESQVREILASHFISPYAFDILLRRPFTKDDFDEFISERLRTFHDAIEDLLIKERIDLSPTLRALDAKIEEVEIGLRRVVDSALNGDASRVPSNVLQKIDDRLQAAMRRTPGFDNDLYGRLIGKLEYADLRDLQDTITNRLLWSSFSVRFSNKDLLCKRFDQLSHLRNGIRHSRRVDEITRKEGEAAILWFEQVNRF